MDIIVYGNGGKRSDAMQTLGFLISEFNALILYKFLFRNGELQIGGISISKVGITQVSFYLQFTFYKLVCNDFLFFFPFISLLTSFHLICYSIERNLIGK